MAELFGFSITRLKKQADPKQAFTSAQADDGTQTVNAGGHFGSYLDMEGTAKTEQDLVRRYREIALHQNAIWQSKILSMKQLSQMN